MSKLGRGFFARKPEVVAQDLLGKLLVRQEKDFTKIGIITETEAYLGRGDKASHSHKGQTKRNEVMFGPAGHAYVYFTYGMHWLLNFVTEKEGLPSGVLIRGVRPIFDTELKIGFKNENDSLKIANGPAKLTKWMKVDGELNRVDITVSDKLFAAQKISIGKNVIQAQKVKASEIIATPRIGVDYAGEDAALLLRYTIDTKKLPS